MLRSAHRPTIRLRHLFGLSLAGLVIAAPLLTGGPAAAETQAITFSGTPLLQLGTLSCPSKPSQSTLRVPAGTTVDFVNRTGRKATLWAGDSQKTLPDKSLVPVTFTTGPASVVIQMLPDCALDLGAHGQVTVTVTAPAGQPAPTSTPTIAGAPSPRTGAPASTAPTKKSHSAPALAPTTAPTDGTPTSTATAPADPGDMPFDSASAVPSAQAQPLVGDPVVPSAPRSASGLLTLIATVGVVGVSAAAIRAIVAQRATRSVHA